MDARRDGRVGVVVGDLQDEGVAAREGQDHRGEERVAPVEPRDPHPPPFRQGGDGGAQEGGLLRPLGEGGAGAALPARGLQGDMRVEGAGGNPPDRPAW